MKRWLAVITMAVLMGTVVACGSSGGGTEECTGPDCGINPPPPAKAIMLQRFNSCNEADSFVKDSLIEDIEKSLDKEIKEGCRYDYSGEVDAVASADYGDATVNFTATNVQEKGVDEADIVKTDGTYTFVLGSDKLHIVKTWPASSLNEVANINIEGIPISMFLMDGKVVVFSAVYPEKSSASKMATTMLMGMVAGGDSYWGSDTKLTFIDVANPAKPKLTRESYYKGSFNTARRIGDNVYVVTRPPLEMPSITYGIDDYKLYPVCGKDGKPKTSASNEFKKAVEALKDKNIKEIEKWNISNHLPKVRHKSGNKTAETTASCDTFSRSEASRGDSLVGVTMVNVNDVTAAKDLNEFIVGGDGQVYATQDAIYVANPENDGDKDKTVIHRFAIDTTDGAPYYFGSAEVEGWLLNQFSMGEYKGYLRVATTSGQANKTGEKVSSSISIINAGDNNMPVVGSVNGIGNGEQIKAVRFIGDRGFVVTFKKIDPLFVIDLRDPATPKIAGELKIPGFSTYLHPLDENHLIGLGKDADDQGDFAWFQGLKLSVFDVTSSASPKEDASVVIGSRGTMSPAFNNHLAFTFDSAKGLLALPLTLCEGAKGGNDLGKFSYNGVQNYNISASSGIKLASELKEITTDDNDDEYGYSGLCNGWFYEGDVQRTIIASDAAGNDSIVVIKNSGVSIYTINGSKQGGVVWQ